MRHRWVICSLPFTGATINYVDRQVLAGLEPTLQAELGWSEVGDGNIVTAFQAAYAAGHVPQATGSYHAVFALASGAYLVALAVLHAPSPRLTPAIALETP